jgi:REP element-mobilizing transposase RayT
VSDRPTSSALAYFITFRCYGTWLHGDPRESTNRWRNVFDTPRLEPRPGLERMERSLMKGAPLILDGPRREAVSAAVEAECLRYEWPLHAVNVRTNHVHAVVSAAVPPEQVMTMLKAAGTRAMRAASMLGAGERAWSRHGSTVYLWAEREVEAACRYVVEGQGDDLNAGP